MSAILLVGDGDVLVTTTFPFPWSPSLLLDDDSMESCGTSFCFRTFGTLLLLLKIAGRAESMDLLHASWIPPPPASTGVCSHDVPSHFALVLWLSLLPPTEKAELV